MAKSKDILTNNLTKHIFNPHEVISETIKLDRNSYTVLLFLNKQYELVARKEVIEFSLLKIDFVKAGCKVIAISGNNNISLQDWFQELQSESGTSDGIGHLSDNRNIYARDFGILKDGGKAGSYPHAIFIINSSQKICYHNVLASEIPYSAEECLRLINAFKVTDTNKVLAPADWKDQGNSIHNGNDSIKNFFMKRKSGKVYTWEEEKEGQIMHKEGNYQPKKLNDASEEQIMCNGMVHPLRKTEHLKIVEWMKFAFCAITILSIRILIVIVSLFFGFIIANIGLIGMIQDKPLTGFRLILKKGCYFIVRIQLSTIGIYTIKQKGTQVPPTIAPVIIAAPHTSSFDGPLIMASYENMPMALTREKLINVPFYGSLLKFMQFLGVDVTSESSKRAIKAEMKRRLLRKEGWQHLLILPEGTLTNGKTLMRFKLGAFLIPVTVQPILIRYKNRLTKAREYGALGAIILSMCQPIAYAELEYLPPYVPSKDEREDPHLFRDNVQKLMANHLRIPVCLKTFRELNDNGGYKIIDI